MVFDLKWYGVLSWFSNNIQLDIGIIIYDFFFFVSVVFVSDINQQIVKKVTEWFKTEIKWKYMKMKFKKVVYDAEFLTIKLHLVCKYLK